MNVKKIVTEHDVTSPGKGLRTAFLEHEIAARKAGQTRPPTYENPLDISILSVDDGIVTIVSET